jgi:uncharacterized protein with HEPN domain
LHLSADALVGNLDSDITLALALARAVEIVGEAARYVPQDIRSRYPAVPWRAIAGTRDKLIHGYFSVDHDVLWAIASGDLEIIDVLDKRV